MKRVRDDTDSFTLRRANSLKYLRGKRRGE